MRKRTDDAQKGNESRTIALARMMDSATGPKERERIRVMLVEEIQQHERPFTDDEHEVMYDTQDRRIDAMIDEMAPKISLLAYHPDTLIVRQMALDIDTPENQERISRSEFDFCAAPGFVADMSDDCLRVNVASSLFMWLRWDIKAQGYVPFTEEED